MAKTNFRSVDEYIATFGEPVRDVLRRVRDAIHAGVPGGEEVISYQIPAVRYHGWIFYFSAHTKHFSLSCPPPFTVFEEFREELTPYKLSKSTIQFPYDRPVPADLIRRMAEFRARENLARAAKGPGDRAGTRPTKK